MQKYIKCLIYLAYIYNVASYYVKKFKHKKKKKKLIMGQNEIINLTCGFKKKNRYQYSLLYKAYHIRAIFRTADYKSPFVYV